MRDKSRWRRLTGDTEKALRCETPSFFIPFHEVRDSRVVHGLRYWTSPQGKRCLCAVLKPGGHMCNRVHTTDLNPGIAGFAADTSGSAGGSVSHLSHVNGSEQGERRECRRKAILLAKHKASQLTLIPTRRAISTCCFAPLTHTHTDRQKDFDFCPSNTRQTSECHENSEGQGVARMLSYCTNTGKKKKTLQTMAKRHVCWWANT